MGGGTHATSLSSHCAVFAMRFTRSCSPTASGSGPPTLSDASPPMAIDIEPRGGVVCQNINYFAQEDRAPRSRKLTTYN